MSQELSFQLSAEFDLASQEVSTAVVEGAAGALATAGSCEFNFTDFNGNKSSMYDQAPKQGFNQDEDKPGRKGEGDDDDDD